IVAGENKWNGVTPGGGGLPFGQHGSYREAYGSPESFAHPPTDATATMVGLGGLQRDDHGAAYLKKGGDGGSWGENGQAGEQPASSREVDGQPGGLAGIAITGLVTVTGNPVLGN
ncbi:MAG: hypothetical protein VXW65_07900, partial [Pseudomonadota bacterium]|nr:hypothetical protein [Pseudomonadota bacterium]